MKSYPILKETESMPSPCLWVDRAAAKRNIGQMITQAGNAGRLRPHIKTHKMREIIEMQVAAGIDKCKAATLSEARIAAEGNCRDVLLAHQPVGPKAVQLAELIDQFPGTVFSTIADDPAAFQEIAAQAGNRERPLAVWIDVDCGMHRTGVGFGTKLAELREEIESHPSAVFGGLHVYDGHIHDRALEKRREQALAIIEEVRQYVGVSGVPSVIGGGSPTFDIWAKETDWECSPGTTVLWDFGYGDSFPDLEYEVAAGLLTRIISKPGDHLLCFDLGYKAVAAEMELAKRVHFPELPEARSVGHSEEHLVVEVPDARKHSVGEVFTAIPRHICPTVALHARAYLAENGKFAAESWKVGARDR